MPSRSVVALAACWLSAACSGTVAEGPAPETPQPESPPEEPVSFLELVPARADGAALVNVARLRETSHGPALTNMVQRLGAHRWEDAVGVDLRTQVERLLVFGVADEGFAPGDLSQVVDALRQSNLGAVIELRAGTFEGEGTCWTGELATVQGRPLDASIPGLSVYRCGRFVVVRRDDLPGPLGPSRGPLSTVLEGVLLSDRDGVDVNHVVFVAVASPEMIDRVSCGQTTVGLAGWQQATIEIAAGLTLRGRYRAASADRVHELEQCVGDGMGGFANVPLFAQLELSDVLENATIRRDDEQPTDVLLEASFSEEELDLMMGLLELVGSGIQ